MSGDSMRRKSRPKKEWREVAKQNQRKESEKARRKARKAYKDPKHVY